MQKTKLAFVSLLSLLVVLAPVSTALAETEKVEEPAKSKAGKLKKEEENSSGKSVFQKIEKNGGRGVSNEKLDKREGEGLIGAITLGIVGAGVAVWDGITSGYSPSKIAVKAFSLGAAGVAAGSAIPEP